MITTTTIGTGLHPNVPFDDYLAIPAVGQSTLKGFEKTAAHGHHAMTHPREESDAFKFGSFVHTGKLEPMRLLERYRVMPAYENDEANLKKDGTKPKSPKATKYYETKKKAFEENCKQDGVKPVEQAEFDNMLAMVQAVNDHPEVRPMLHKPGRAELTGVFEFEGVKGKFRLDWLSDDEECDDLKTCKSASDKDLSRAIADYGYDVQYFWYSEGYKAITGHYPRSFRFTFVEKEGHHGVRVVDLAGDPAWWEGGKARCMECLKRYKHGMRTGEWPSYASTVFKPHAPKWYAEKYLPDNTPSPKCTAQAAGV